MAAFRRLAIAGMCFAPEASTSEFIIFEAGPAGFLDGVLALVLFHFFVELVSQGYAVELC